MNPQDVSVAKDFIWIILAMFGFFGSVIAAIFALGKLRAGIVTKKELYDDKGRGIYMTEEDCLTSRGECKSIICTKIDKVDRKLDDFIKEEKEKEKLFKIYKEMMSKEMQQVSFFMGEITGIFKSSGIEIKKLKVGE